MEEVHWRPYHPESSRGLKLGEVEVEAAGAWGPLGSAWAQEELGCMKMCCRSEPWCKDPLVHLQCTSWVPAQSLGTASLEILRVAFSSTSQHTFCNFFLPREKPEGLFELPPLHLSLKAFPLIPAGIISVVCGAQGQSSGQKVLLRT